jgi:hypothetical protein
MLAHWRHLHRARIALFANPAGGFPGANRRHFAWLDNLLCLRKRCHVRRAPLHPHPVAPYIHTHRGKTRSSVLPATLAATAHRPDLALIQSMGVKIVLSGGFWPQNEQPEIKACAQI